MREGNENLEHHGPDRSPIRYPHVRVSPVMVAPPPSPSQGPADDPRASPGPILATRHIAVFNDSQTATSSDRRHPRRRPLRPGQRIPRLIRSTEVLGPGELEYEDTPRERRGRELGLPDHWVRDSIMARREFHQWVNMSDLLGPDRSDTSEEL